MDGHHHADGPVVLDIGGDIGAALVIGDDALGGREVEIRRHGRQWDGEHVAFHRRNTDAGAVTAAVFPRLRSGTWEVRLRDAPADDAPPAFGVTGGQVTHVV
jgi:hypothetical protein